MEKDIVYIEWVDTIADTEGGWKDEENTNEFFERTDNVVYQVGLLWSEDQDYINLVTMVMDGEEPLISGRVKIPKRWVLCRKTLNIK